MRDPRPAGDAAFAAAARQDVIMRAVLVERFGVRPAVAEVPDPAVADHGAVLHVEATGLCRSDWHGWQGHDPDITLPHVPGHEIAGTIAAIGRDVTGWSAGDRVTVPFVCACGACRQCLDGHHQVCLNQEQPGFTYWGSFAEYVAIPRAGVNLVALPDALSFDAGASLGCRFATAYRAVRQVGRVRAGEWAAVFGCGGVGLSAIMIAVASGAQVVAIDISPAALELAARHGAARTLTSGPGIEQRIREITGGGASLSIDAIGSAQVAQSALRSLRPQGRHVQVGLLPGGVSLDMTTLIGRELQWLGSHGMAAHGYPEMLAAAGSGALRPDELVTRVIGLDEVPGALAAMSTASVPGVTVIRPGGAPAGPQVPRDAGGQGEGAG
jgi:D-arabinose 1-dehydrogenase-like Zn-dependent alcohol dehydrogenase